MNVCAHTTHTHKQVGILRFCLLPADRRALAALMEGGCRCTLLVSGCDMLVPGAHARVTAKHLHAARVLHCRDSGHFLQLEQPDVVTNTVLGHIHNCGETSLFD